MQTSKKGIDLIKSFEGCRLTAYKCPAGVLTIGYGHTGADVKPSQKITQEQATKLLQNDLKKYELHVNNLKRNFNQNEFDALVSFCYNCGVGCLHTLCKNRTNSQIASAILLYNKANGKPLAGLTRRRKAERELFVQKSGLKAKVTASVLNVRQTCSTDSKIVMTLPKNTIVEILENKNGWGRISDGWISSKYTEMVV